MRRVKWGSISSELLMCGGGVLDQLLGLSRNIDNMKSKLKNVYNYLYYLDFKLHL